MPKEHISLREKLAAALRSMMVEENGKLIPAIPYDDARKMTADEVISLFHFDHGVLEAFGGPAKHWNLTPRFIAEHRSKTAKTDIPAIHKTKRVSAAHETFRRKVLAKAGQECYEMSSEKKPKAAWPKGRKLQSRGFQKTR